MASISRTILCLSRAKGQALEGAAACFAVALFVITVLQEFRGLDERGMKEVMSEHRLVDLRYIFVPEELRGLGFTYEGVVRP